MTTPQKTSIRKKAKYIAYLLFCLGVVLAALGQYAFHNDPLVAIGIIIVAISLIPFLIAHPELLFFNP